VRLALHRKDIQSVGGVRKDIDDQRAAIYGQRLPDRPLFNRRPRRP
jgi:hypothetical protein